MWVTCQLLVLLAAAFRLQLAALNVEANKLYELKFQQEPDNSTVILKRELQQQILKCQVRLAAKGAKLEGKVSNVSLSVDWLRDGRALSEVSVLNVEFKTGGGSASQKSDKRQKSRIEIKNTLNGVQLKLTSRLKISQLKVNDSGQYKCLARASYFGNGPQSELEVARSGKIDLALESGSARLEVVGSGKTARVREEQKQPVKWEATNVNPANDTRHAARSGQQSLAADTDELSSGSPLANGRATANGRNEMANGDNGEVESFVGETSEKSPQQPAMNPFEDDEDLFRIDSDRGELISGRNQLAANDNELQQQQRRLLSQTDQRGSEESIDDGHKELDLAGDNNESSASNQLRAGQRRLYEQDRKGNTRYHVVNERNQDASSDASLRFQLAKFVHNIAPELSCYTGLGERYKGNLSTSADRRPCLYWSQARDSRNNLSFELGTDYEGHNHCRNPNQDARGPWCYVRYNEELDSDRHGTRNLIRVIPVRAQVSGSTGSVPDVRVYVQRECLVRPCSEFLWLYIVAPPLGLLIFLTCLVYLIIRTRRKSLYESMFVSGSRKKKTLPRIGKLLRSKSRFAARKIGASKKKCSSSYLDEDIFEIVDDLDWSDGQKQSMSPKSSESLKLNSSFSASSIDTQPKLSGCKSVNPIFNERILDDCGIQSGDLLKNGFNKSVTQVGPMFATLRCHLRSSKSFQPEARSNKSSTFIEQVVDSASNKIPTDWPASSVSDSSVSPASSSRQNCKRTAGTSPSTATSHLISYSSTAEDMGSLEDGDEKYINACDLPRLSTTSVVAITGKQPLYEGKMSQVLLAHVKSQEHDESGAIFGPAGALVAVCSLKQSGNIDTSIFWPTQLKLRHLNHLNILKLVGFTQPTHEIGIEQSCSLVYDMTQLIDLSEWLKQQNRESETIGGESSLRRNLTCLSKQVALALDYLHDQGLIYKDLACRNCFLDPTKMLVKLASFNIELVLRGPESATQSLSSMVRPKYLNDYYVINSRPSDCQLLPLSWIPLESILFNKFNRQTDIWSFGCLLYELFSLGEVAYFGYSSKQIIDSVRSNLMPPQPLLCPNGVYKLMRKCLSDIPSNRPSIKQVYEQLNLYSGQCSSFLDHHLCSLSPNPRSRKV